MLTAAIPVCSTTDLNGRCYTSLQKYSDLRRLHIPAAQGKRHGTHAAIATSVYVFWLLFRCLALTPKKIANPVFGLEQDANLDGHFLTKKHFGNF
jgi:hypothetical protein